MAVVPAAIMSAVVHAVTGAAVAVAVPVRLVQHYHCSSSTICLQWW